MLSKAWNSFLKCYMVPLVDTEEAKLYGLEMQGRKGDMPASTIGLTPWGDLLKSMLISLFLSFIYVEPLEMSQARLNYIEWKKLRGLPTESAQTAYVSTIKTIAQRNGREIDVDQLGWLAGMNCVMMIWIVSCHCPSVQHHMCGPDITYATAYYSFWNLQNLLWMIRL